MKIYSFLVLLFFLMTTSCTTNRKDNPNVALTNEIDTYITKIIDIQKIPGLAVAVIKNDTVIYKNYFGITNIDASSMVNEKTIFRLYSLTKLMTTTSVFKLIEENKLSLDDMLSEHFDGLPTRWQGIKIKNQLSHSSGLPDVRNLTKELSDNSLSDTDFIKMLYTEDMDFVTGEDWSYNQTNFLLLKLLIEKITNIPFEEYILNHQFSGATTEDVLFSSDPFENIPNRAKYYNYDKKLNTFKTKPEFPGKRGHPLNGVNITLDEYIKWNEKLDNDMHLEPSIKALMWTPFDFKKSDRDFLYGWDVYDVNGYKSYGFSGGGVSGYRKFTESGLSIIVLTNGYKYYSVHNNMIDYIASIIDTSLVDEDFILRENILATYLLKDKPTSPESIYSKVREMNPDKNLEEVFKSIGFLLFFQLDRKQEAIELFKLNVLEYPLSYDTYGSLGYLYFLTDQFELAKENYTKALQLNPENSYSKRRLKEIDEILKRSD